MTPSRLSASTDLFREAMHKVVRLLFEPVFKCKRNGLLPDGSTVLEHASSLTMPYRYWVWQSACAHSLVLSNTLH